MKENINQIFTHCVCVCDDVLYSVLYTVGSVDRTKWWTRINKNRVIKAKNVDASVPRLEWKSEMKTTNKIIVREEVATMPSELPHH